ncbi:16S rRNA (cytosine(967)-C(5))-methyltransferase RsmB [Castellaniella caeni]|uniref:16S rRNA (cytosine(967)-C(5))-methyltransferase RsmB n=1 Tax=Castellaniella caeni TaxID=266123 RepID=UPI000C9F6B2B|nr:16S rRNA (cytosine(967)-C(5))-methyltransferase RsmB [Castellaniella caeni]
MAQAELAEQLLAAARAIRGVLTGVSLSEALEQTPAALRPGAQALAFYAMRRLGFATALREQLVPRRPPDRLTEALLLLGLCLLEASHQQVDGIPLAAGTPRYAAHTLVHQLVQAAGADRHTRPAKALINAVLRRYGRERHAIRATLTEQPRARFNHPDWWVEALRQAWPEHWQAMLQAADQTPPMTLRTNVRQITRAALLDQLSAAGIAAHPVGEAGLVLEQPRPVRDIPGFDAGWWSVQDASAQRAGALLPLRDGLRVLDACAAPGGKTAHLLERHSLRLTALDSDEKRLARVADNLRRLQLPSDQVQLCCADAAQPSQWWDGQPYDAILADVPCTASGVVRRHPDIRWLRRPEDVSRTAALQARIIDALWPLLAPGGHLLYATCSIFPQEGESQIQAFLARHADARRLSAPGQILPGDAGDGFFYALLTKPVG